MTLDYPGQSLSTTHVAYLARMNVAKLLGCEPGAFMTDPRGTRLAAFGRQLAMHLAHVVAGRRHDEIARAFRRNRSTAQHHFEIVENLRDIPDMDRFLDILERRFAAQLDYAENHPGQAWAEALRAMDAAVESGTLESDVHFDAKYVTSIFRKTLLRRVE